MSRISLLLIACAVFNSIFSKAEKFFIADGDGTGFIAAIHQANQNNEADTIYLALRGRYLFTNPIPAVFDGNSALPDVVLDQTLANKIIVYGNGSALERDINAPPFRIWMVFGGSLELYDVVILNGYLNGNPGLNGAGIADLGELVVYNSTFANNTAAFLGGALYIGVQSSPTTLTNCTITGNTASAGSAIYFFSSNASITNCTIVGNPNTGTTGAGLHNVLIVDDPNRRVFVKNSIVALNTNKAGTQNDVSGTLISLARNLIGANNDANTEVYMPVGMPNYLQDYVGTSASPVDPLVNPLADNGGLTPTMAIQSANSLAFNNGGLPVFVISTDQAGNYRIGNAEIGSLEFNNNPVLNPSIEIRQASTVISNGDTFDFGDIITPQSSGAVEFKIRNTGFFRKLNLLSRPKIILTGVDANDFVVDQSMTQQEIEDGSETSFFVTFAPLSLGSKSATLSIASNDMEKTVFTIELAGNFTDHLPVINIRLGVTAVSPVCEGSPTSVTIKNSESGVDYEVFNGTAAVSAVVAGSGGAITIPIAAESLPAGNTTLKVLGTKSGVGSDTLKTKPIVRVDTPFTITGHPSGVTKTSGQSASFSLATSGTNLIYRWRKGITALSDNTRFSGTGSFTFTISDLTVADAGDYNCMITSACGSITSSNATLIVNKTVPVITFTSLRTEGLTGEELTISATSSSPAEIAFEITGGTGEGSFKSPARLTLESPGTLEVTASQTSTPDYEPATASQVITVLDQVTAVETPGVENTILFPNPAGGEITIQSLAETIYLIDVRGVAVKEWKVLPGTVTLTIEGFSRGVYLLKGHHGNNVVFLRRVVKK